MLITFTTMRKLLPFKEFQNIQFFLSFLLGWFVFGNVWNLLARLSQHTSGKLINLIFHKRLIFIDAIVTCIKLQNYENKIISCTSDFCSILCFSRFENLRFFKF